MDLCLGDWGFKMNEENEKKLVKEFPKLYEGCGKTTDESLMAFGFACDDGWFDLIYQLSKDITALDPKATANQIKEKFGGLRFYATVQNEKAFDLIHKAEKESYKTCETCGKKGILRKNLGWILTLCLKHYKEIKKTRAMG